MKELFLQDISYREYSSKLHTQAHTNKQHSIYRYPMVENTFLKRCTNKKKCKRRQYTHLISLRNISEFALNILQILKWDFVLVRINP